MGGNAKYRYHTAVIRNSNSESGFQAMRDSNGNLIRIPESERVVGRDKRTANRANAKERMLNAKSLRQMRDLAKEYRNINKKWPIGSVTEQNFDEYNNDINRRNQIEVMLGTLANLVQQGIVSNPYAMSKQDRDNVEKLLGIKFS